MKKENNQNQPFNEELLKQNSEAQNENNTAFKETGPMETTDKPKKKKTIKKILLGIFVVLFVVLSALCIRYWHVVRMVVNWDNIVAYVNSRRYTQEELENKMAQNKAKMEKLADKSDLINIRGELTEEEKEALASGEITKEQAKQIVRGETTLKQIRKENQSKEPSGEKEPPSKPVQTSPKGEENPRVSEIVSELYVIQADFISRLEAVGDRAYADYQATMYDRSQVMTIVDRYTATVGALESECDKKVNALIKELKKELAKAGEDNSLAKEIQNYYYTEKSLKKSYYLNKLDDEDYK